jgi:hypothetical protein
MTTTWLVVQTAAASTLTRMAWKERFSWPCSCSIWSACAPLDVADTWRDAASSYEAVAAEEGICCSNHVAGAVLWGAWA